MDVHTSNKNQKRASIVKIAQEYRNLMRLSSPSNEELDRIERILELAIYDTELNDLLYQVDEQFTLEINLIENDNLDYSSIKNVNFNEEYYSQILSKDISILEEQPLKNDLIQQSEDSCNVVSFPSLYVPNPTKKWNWQILGHNFKHTIFIFVAGGVLASVVIPGLCSLIKNNYLTDDIKQPMKSSVMQSKANLNYFNIPICNLNVDSSSKEILDYYASYSKLENDVISKKLQPLEIKMQVRQLQKQAEMRQRQAEKNQRFAEIEKTQAENQNLYDKAQELKNQANKSLAESRKWHCLAQQVLTLIY